MSARTRRFPSVAATNQITNPTRTPIVALSMSQSSHRTTQGWRLSWAPTVRSSDRSPRPDERRRRTLSSNAAGAQPHASHVPLQRLLAAGAHCLPAPAARNHPRVTARSNVCQISYRIPSAELPLKMPLREPQYGEYERPNAEPEHNDN